MLTYEGVSELPDVNISDILILLNALRLLVTAWAQAGTCKVPSKLLYDDVHKEYKKVRTCHLSKSTAYFSFVWRKAQAFKGSPNTCIEWVLDRHRNTVNKARELYLAGWPWGEALQQCTETHCLVLWQIGDQGPQGRWNCFF